MQSISSVGRSLLRIAFRRGSPQRIQYSGRLTTTALLGLLLLAAATQRLVFRSDLVDICLYLFTTAAGLYLGTALLSRNCSPGRVRATLQATALLLAAAHLLMLLTAPASRALPWLPPTVAAALGIILTLGLSNCVQYALGRPRAAAVAATVAWVLAMAAFYAAMLPLTQIALG